MLSTSLALGVKLGPDPVGASGLMSPVAGAKLAAREQALAHRERALAQYAADLADRSAAADAKHKANAADLATERRRLEASQIALTTLERELEARKRAAEEWESQLRARETTLAMSAAGRQRPKRQEASYSDEPPDEQLDAAADERSYGGSATPLEGEEEEASGEEASGEEDNGEEAADDRDRAWTDWQAVRDESSGRVYYWQPVSGEVSWEIVGDRGRSGEVSWAPVDGAVEEAIEEAEAGEQAWAEVEEEVEAADALPEEEEEEEEEEKVEDDELVEIEPPSQPPLQRLHQRQMRARQQPQVSSPSLTDGPLSQHRRVVVVAPGEGQPGEEHRSGNRRAPSTHEAAARAATRQVAGAGAGVGASPTASKKSWNQQSEELRAAMQAARRGGGPPAAPQPPDDENDGRVECPKCLRRFSAKAAERHIPQCKHTPKRRVSPKRSPERR